MADANSPQRSSLEGYYSTSIAHLRAGSCQEEWMSILAPFIIR
ncbi:hypothetical protein HMPREF0636_1537 [Porphyromonas catoniae ATCC 51270]|uniref:Uncharacterized protein n=1 Tax=Porphyromonas catoniae ATCC 51270 TaxID=887901 RepID=Z4WRF0_9PORP|nr:hypothetical protein HMPREF0636_1537 [Porphyromonas catoniae ATCC 51270]